MPQANMFQRSNGPTGEAAYQSVGNLSCLLDHRWRERGGSVAPLAFLASACTRGGSGESKRLADARACRGRALAVGESRYFPRIRFGNHPDGHWLWRAPPSHDQLSRGPTRTRNH